MASFQNKSITMYLKPLDTQPASALNKCARWLVIEGRYGTYEGAVKYLAELQYNDIQKYRRILSEYYNATEQKKEFVVRKDVNKYRSTVSNSYGDEPHMYISFM
mgnify:CR=1 FL=1